MRWPNALQHESTDRDRHKSGLLILGPVLIISTMLTPIEGALWLVAPWCAMILLRNTNHRRQPGSFLADYVVLLLIASAVVSFAFSPFREVSLKPTLYFIGYYVSVFLLSRIVSSIDDLQKLAAGIVLAGSLVLLRSIAEANVFFSSSDRRLEGALGQANATGALAAVTLVSALLLRGAFALRRRTPIGKFAAANLMAIALAVVVLVLSGSRGAFFASALFVMLYLLVMFPHNRARTSAFIIAAFSAAWIAKDYIIQLSITNRIWHLIWEMGLISFPPLENYQGSVDIRESLKVVAVDIFSQFPFTGSGLGTFKEYSNFVYTHTTFYEIVYALGGIGCAVFASYWSAIVRELISARQSLMMKSAAPMLFAAVIPYLVVQGMSLPLVTSRSHLPLFALLLAAGRLARNEKRAGPVIGARFREVPRG